MASAASSSSAARDEPGDEGADAEGDDAEDEKGGGGADRKGVWQRASGTGVDDRREEREEGEDDSGRAEDADGRAPDSRSVPPPFRYPF